MSEHVTRQKLADEAGESDPITAKSCNIDDWNPLVRWMPVPEVE